MHYMIQIDLATLKAATLERFDGTAWVKRWTSPGGDNYVGVYASGTAMIHGPVRDAGKPWFEVECTSPEVLTDINAVETHTMRSKIRNSPSMRAVYRAQERKLIRNTQGNPVGPLPAHGICGTRLASSFLDDLKLDEADEFQDMEPSQKP